MGTLRNLAVENASSPSVPPLRHEDVNVGVLLAEHWESSTDRPAPFVPGVEGISLETWVTEVPLEAIREGEEFEEQKYENPPPPSPISSPIPPIIPDIIPV